MKKRPRSWVIVGWLFVVIGCASAARGVWPLIRGDASGGATRWTAHDWLDVGLVLFSAFLALLGGGYLLRGAAWARWVCAIWMGLHVVLSLFHDWEKLLLHAALFAVILYALFSTRRAA